MGQHIGDRCYITPSYHSARDYAQVAARYEKSIELEANNDVSLTTPPDDASYNSPLKTMLFVEAVRDFEKTSDCHQRMCILLFFVQDFFAMQGCVVKQNESIVSGHLSDCDYLEGKQQYWEIKFNKKESVYNRISIFKVDYQLELILPDLPNTYEERAKFATEETAGLNESMSFSMGIKR